MQCTSHAAEVLTLLLSLTPYLRLFYLALYPSKHDMWAMKDPDENKSYKYVAGLLMVLPQALRLSPGFRTCEDGKAMFR